jgi:hypothetical protein
LTTTEVADAATTTDPDKAAPHTAGDALLEQFAPAVIVPVKAGELSGAAPSSAITCATVKADGIEDEAPLFPKIVLGEIALGTQE